MVFQKLTQVCYIFFDSIFLHTFHKFHVFQKCWVILDQHMWNRKKACFRTLKQLVWFGVSLGIGVMVLL